jgi:hypothetical protein
MSTPTKRDRYLMKLAQGECEVYFTKVDGTTRYMLCTNNPELIPDDKLPKIVEGKEKKINEETIACFDLKLGKWRSFRVDSIIDFEPSPW